MALLPLTCCALAFSGRPATSASLPRSQLALPLHPSLPPRSATPLQPSVHAAAQDGPLCRSRITMQESSAPPVMSAIVVGGSGRVGGSTVRWLHKLTEREGTPIRLALGGRSSSSFKAACRRMEQLGMDTRELEFVQMDLDDPSSVAAAVNGRSLCIHTAGPFQQRKTPVLLKACIDARVPYCDVCDEIVLARSSKDLAARAAEAGVPAIVSCGIWPGVSALMAAEAKERMGSCDRIDFSFFTAGTGNAGPTIVSATFLLLNQDALIAQTGSLVGKEPWTEQRTIDFGGSIGLRPTWLLDNPDVPTCAVALDVPNMSSRFGTAPLVWNYLFGAMKALPSALLGDKGKMQALALFSEPIIRAVDLLVGATNAMRVDAYADGSETPDMTFRIAHDDLEQCVGQATAAFALELLGGSVAPGVWYPAELSGATRAQILEKVREDAIVWEI